MRAALLLAGLLFLPGTLDAFGTPKAAAIQVIGVAWGAFALAGLWLAARARPADAPAALAPLDLAVVAWVAAALLSAGFAPSLHVAWLGEPGERDGVLTTLGVAGLYAATRAGHATDADAERTLDVFVWAAVASAAYALLQLAGLDPVRWADPVTYQAGGQAALRPGATLGVTTTFGAIVAPALAITMARPLTGRTSVWRDAPLAAVLAAAAAATLSRGVWLAAAAGGLAALALGLRGARPGAARRVVAVLAAPALAVLLVVGTRLAPVAARLGEGSGGETGSGASRLLFARAAWRLVREHPWFGVGPDGFGLAFPAIQTPELWRGGWLGKPGHAHSVALETLATRGWAGALAGLVWLGALAWALRRRDAGPFTAPLAAALAALVAAGAFNVVGPAAAAAFAVLSALALSAAAFPERPRALRLLPWAAAIALAWPLPAQLRASFDAGVAKSALTASVGAPAPLRARLIEVADSLGAAAVARAPQDDAVWRMAADAATIRATERLAAGDTLAARAAAERALAAARGASARVPVRALNEQRLASALVLSGRLAPDSATRTTRLAQAEPHWVAALQASPADGLMRVARVRDLLALGRLDDALAEARLLAGMYPEAAPGHALEAQVLHALGRDDEARAALARARAARPE